MKIQILGSGCPNCRKLEENARAAAKTLGIDAEFEKVTDSDEILEMGVMRTPGLAIDGEVRQQGKVLTPVEIVQIIESTQS
ncbi:MAG: thioredoxin family protein [Alkalispirochaeta sp.]